MKSLHFVQVACGLAAGLFLSLTGTANAAEGQVAAPSASAVVKQREFAASGAINAGVVKKGTTAAAGVSVAGGEKSLPAGGLIVPPKPKKEGLEAAGAVKAKVAQP